MSDKKYNALQLLHKIHVRIADDCPAWWGCRSKSFNGLLIAIEGICAMLARDKFTDKEIAEFWECPVNFIYAVKRIKEDAIEKLREEYRECKEISQAAQKRISDGVMISEKEAVMALCEIILKYYDKIEKEMQK